MGSREKAEDKNTPEGFNIDIYWLDQDNWPEGDVTVWKPAEPDGYVPLFPFAGAMIDQVPWRS